MENEDPPIINATLNFDDKSNDTLIPSTPVTDVVQAPPEVIEEQTSNRRKSVRPRRPRIVESPAVSTSPSSKPKPKYSKRKIGDATPATAPKGTVSPVAQPPKPKRGRRLSSAAPVVAVAEEPTWAPPPAEQQPDADVPTLPEDEVEGTSRDKKLRKKNKIPADVPPIEGLPDYGRMMKKLNAIARRLRATVIESEIADVPPEASPEAHLLPTDPQFLPAAEIDVIPDPQAMLEESSNLSKPPSEAAKTPGEKKSKKQILEEEFRKHQPSVLKFFGSNKPLDGSPEIGEEAMDDTPVEITTPVTGRRCYLVGEPELAQYVSEWRVLKMSNLKAPMGRIFVSKPVAGKSDLSRVLDKSEIGSKKASVYAGDNPVNRVRLRRPRPIYISIHDRERPPVKMIVTHRSKFISRRKPLGVDAVIDYEKDSDEEYEEEKEGEDLNSDADNEEENNELEEGAESEADSFFVSDGHFSQDENLSDDEAMVARRRRQEMQIDAEGKATLQLITFSPADLANADTDYSNEPAHAKWFKTIMEEAVVKIADPDNYFNANPAEDDNKVKKQPAPKPDKPPKTEKPVIDWPTIRAELAKYIHGKNTNIDSLCNDYKVVRPEVSGNAIKAEIRSIASWVKRAELSGKIAWYVKPELFGDLGLNDEEMMTLVNERKVVGKEQAPTGTLNFKPAKEDTSQQVESREVIHN